MQIVEIAQAIDDMQDGLESLLFLGVSSKTMPEEAFTLYASLSDNLRNLPTTKLKGYLENLEIIIKNQLEKILQYSGLDFASDEAIEFLSLSEDRSDESPAALLEEFKRTAQTSVSLKVLLKKRGVSTPGSALPVPRDVIVKQIEQLDVQEQQQRAKIKDKIVDMQHDITLMIQNPNHPATLKQTLMEVCDNLDKDLQSIQSGGALNRLSFMAEAQEITDVQPGEVVDEQGQAAAAQKNESGFYETANRWLNTPWDVDWKQIKDQYKQ